MSHFSLTAPISLAKRLRTGKPLWLSLAVSFAAVAQSQFQTITYVGPLNGRAWIGVPTPLRAITTSGLPVEYSLIRGPANLDGDQLVATNVGTILIEARVPGSAVYRPATSRFLLNRDFIQMLQAGSVSVLSAPANATDVRLVGDLAYVATDSAGLKIVDIREPANPRLVGELGASRIARAVEVVGNRAYVLAGSDLDVVDVADPTKPVLLSSTRFPGVFNQLRIRVQGDRAYLACNSAGLLVVDIADAALPKLLGRWDSPGLALGVDVADGFAFVADQFYGLQIVDVRNPALPIPVTSEALPGAASDVTVVSGIAYVACDSGGIVSVDVRDPFRPRRLGSNNWIRFSQVRHAADLLFGRGVLDAVDPAILEERGGSTPLGRFDIQGEIVADVWRSTGELRLFRWRRGFEQPASVPGELMFTPTPQDLPQPLKSIGLLRTYTVLEGPARIEEGRLRLTGTGNVVLKSENPGNIQYFPFASTNTFRVVPPTLHLFWQAITVSNVGEGMSLQWIPTGATLESAPSPEGDWTAIPSFQPHIVTPDEAQRFFRIRVPGL